MSVGANNEGDPYSALQYLVYSAGALYFAGMAHDDMETTAMLMTRWDCVNH